MTTSGEPPCRAGKSSTGISELTVPETDSASTANETPSAMPTVMSADTDRTCNRPEAYESTRTLPETPTIDAPPET